MQTKPAQPQAPAQDAPPSRWQKLKLAYRIFNAITLVSLVIMIVLVLHKSPAPAVVTDPAAASRVEQKFAAADQAQATGQPAQVALDSTELNSYLAQNLDIAGPQTAAPSAPPVDAPAPAVSPLASPVASPVANLSASDQAALEQAQSSVRDVKIDMDGDLVKAYVVFNMHGEDLSLELDGHIGSENGYMKFVPVAGKLGSLPLPQSALDAAVDKLMSSPENREKLRLPEGISDVQVQNGQAVVTYK